jgi:hypothetical protein
MRGIMKNNGFRKIGDWNINKSGKLDINYPSSIKNVPGVIAIIVNNEPMFFSATSHYGPRIRDFKHSLSGNTLKARIHSNIIEALRVNKVVSLWVKDTHSPFIEKNELMKKHNPKWNLLKFGYNKSLVNTTEKC